MKSANSKCQKTGECCDKILIIVMSITMLLCCFLLIGMFLIYKLISSSSWIDLTGLTNTYEGLVASYFIFYIIVLISLSVRMCLKKLICGISTAIFMASSVILLVVSGVLIVQVTQDSLNLTTGNNSYSR